MNRPRPLFWLGLRLFALVADLMRGKRPDRHEELAGPVFTADGVSWAFTGPVCPVQAEGAVDGFPFYFHARHDEWTFGLANGREPDPVGIESEADGFYRAATCEDASWLPLDQAKAIVERCIDEFQKYQS